MFVTLDRETYRKRPRYHEVKDLGSLSCQSIFIVHSARQLTHSTHESSNGVIRKSLISTDSALNIGNFEMDILKLLLLIIGDRSDQIIDSRNQDLSFGLDQFGH